MGILYPWRGGDQRLLKKRPAKRMLVKATVNGTRALQEGGERSHSSGGGGGKDLGGKKGVGVKKHHHCW